MWIVVAGSAVVLVTFAAYAWGVHSTRILAKRQLANLTLGPIEMQLELVSVEAGRMPEEVKSVISRSVNMSLSAIAVEQPEVGALNAGALAALCSAVKQREKLLQGSTSALVQRYLREVEVDLRLEAVQRRKVAPATKCTLLD